MDTDSEESLMKQASTAWLVPLLLIGCGPASSTPPYATVSSLAGESTQVFWGDTHLHTSYSPDAFFFGNATADPDTA